jgi:predicted metal-dependent peptidase
VVLDVSGSVDAELLSRFTQEIEAIARRLEAALVLVVGDDRVHCVRSFEPGAVRLADMTFEGGGGTDFTPLLQEAQRYQPDAAVVLTDLQGPATYEPPFPVLWALPPAWHAAKPPFGRKLALV